MLKVNPTNALLQMLLLVLLGLVLLDRSIDDTEAIGLRLMTFPNLFLLVSTEFASP